MITDGLKYLLNSEYSKHLKDSNAISEQNLDPLIIAHKYRCEYISFICALFAYGNVKAIVNFLSNIDFRILDEKESYIQDKLKNKYYRFQKNEDVCNIFLILSRIKKETSLEDLFLIGYKKNHNILEGLESLLLEIRKNYTGNTDGFNFLVSKLDRVYVSPNKRLNMYLRWMVRKDNIDLGLWKNVEKKDLIIPLDTHIFRQSKKLGLLSRKTYDLKAALEITNNLRKLDPDDPVKYDFAIYRMGQNSST